MNYLDLFHGIGGFALGAYWAGMKFDKHYCSDNNEYCKKIYKLRFPDSIQLGDITEIDFKKLPKGDWIITGGFPCQDISVAGKGEGIEGKRSGLWFDMWRAIRVLRPRFTIIENVGAITRRGLSTLLSNLTEIGYDAEWQDIRASDVGAPHKRERIWIVAYSKRKSNWIHKQRIWGLPTRESKKRDGNTDKEISNSASGRLETSRPTFASREKTNSVSRLSGKQIRKNNWWATEPDVGRLAHGIPNRVDRLKALGNSIVPQIAEVLFKQIDL